MAAIEYGLRRLNDDGTVGDWLETFDPDGGENPYRPEAATWTPDPDLALRFESHVAARAMWKKKSRRTPVRPDGKPNRPLSAMALQVALLPERSEEAK
jgi:hypothetical protein